MRNELERKSKSVNHFGCRISCKKYSAKLLREEYALIDNKLSLPYSKLMEKYYYEEDGKYYYTDEWCRKQRSMCLENFDLNMKFYESLDKEKFEKEIRKFMFTHRRFKQVFDLNKYEDVSGYYIMVLDEYKQLYIGTSENIKRRIMYHWSHNKEFDRLLFPMNNVEKSLLSIDSFRALDTTRIYAAKTTRIYEKEDEYINCFSDEFVCNRVGGGKIEALFELVGMTKNRNLKR